MTEYDNNNSGVLFPNDRRTNDKAPDFTGTITVNGKQLQLAAWKRESRAGKKFLSIKVSEPPAKGTPSAKPAYASRNDESPPIRDEDII